MSTFFGIELGKRSLLVQQASLNVAGHNIANANTAGYSRQRAIHTATDPYTVPGLNSPAGAGQVGTGVKIEQIMRMKDNFITARLNHENQSLGAWEARRDNLSQIEMILSEPSEDGLRNLMDLFWKSWQNLNNDPESQGVREAVKQQADTLVDAFHHTHKQLVDLREDINQDIGVNVTRINTLAEKISLLNKRIVSIESDTNKNANDLRDQRDLLVKQMSELINVNAREDSRGNLNLSISGVSFVSGDSFNKISAQEDGAGMNQLVWDHIGQPVTVTSGKIAGSMDVRDYDIPAYIDKLNELAKGIVEEVNAVHSSGVDLNGAPGGNFFDPAKITAATMSLDLAIISDVNNIAAASVGGGVGDGSNALAISQLKDKLTMAGNKATFNDFFTGVVAGLGVNAEKSETMYGNQKVLVQSLQNQQESVSGVSLDEEMGNMIKFQQSYNAAAKMITKVDEMLNTLINGMI